MTDKILKGPQVAEATGLSVESIRRLEAKGEFPRHAKISIRAVGWRQSDVQAWIEHRFQDYEDHVA
jgi:prophage regulatory protein